MKLAHVLEKEHPVRQIDNIYEDTILCSDEDLNPRHHREIGYL